MIIKATQKLTKKLKADLSDPIVDSSIPLDEWYANLFTIERAQYILTTETTTLFSVVMIGRGIVDETTFLESWILNTRSYFSLIGGEDIFRKYIGPKTDQYVFAKTNNRSVLGSMNDMINMSKYLSAVREMSPVDLSEHINKTPFKYIGYQSPINIFRDLEI